MNCPTAACLGPYETPSLWYDVQVIWNAFEPYILFGVGLWLVCFLVVARRQWADRRATRLKQS